MLRLLRSVSLRDYRAAPMRLALMVGGIAAGVGLIAALGIINVSVLSNFRASLERAAGKAALQVVLGTGEVGFDEAAVAAVGKDTRGVERVRSRPRLAGHHGRLRRYAAALRRRPDHGCDRLVRRASRGRGDRRAPVHERPAVGPAHRGVRLAQRRAGGGPCSVRQPEGHRAASCPGPPARRGAGDRVRRQSRRDGSAGGAAAPRQGGPCRSGRRPPAAGRGRGERPGASREGAPVLTVGDPSRAARRAVRARDRRVPGHARRPQPALPARRRIHRLQHDRDRGHAARPRLRHHARGRRRAPRHLRVDADGGNPDRPGRVAARHRAGPRHGACPAPAGRAVDGRDLPDALHGRDLHADRLADRLVLRPRRRRRGGSGDRPGPQGEPAGSPGS